MTGGEFIYMLVSVNRQCKARQAAVVKDKRDKQQKVLQSLFWADVFLYSAYFLLVLTSIWKQDKRLILTMEDLSKALCEVITIVFQITLA